jgi:pimeloyl-ACP methyl ester carboxylesterase
VKNIVAGVLDIAYLDQGPVDGPVVVLRHGFPYDIRAYDDVVARLSHAGYRCIVPYLRGYGPTPPRRLALANRLRSVLTCWRCWTLSALARQSLPGTTGVGAPPVW